MKVLSLFDGMSCGRQALERLSIPVEKYYACEVDKHAMGVTRYNYPDTVFLGDVRDLDVTQLPKIDLLLGGSPCTDLSLAGSQRGIGSDSLEQYLKLKTEGFEFVGQSFLFWEYIRIRQELLEKNPCLTWLLENVKMKKDFKEAFDAIAGGNCIQINSSLVSAQNRVRNYWSNIEGVSQPEDKKIFIKDILESGVSDREKSFCLDASYSKGGNLKTYFEKKRRQLIFELEKMKTLRHCSQDNSLLVTGCRQVGRRISEDGTRKDEDKSIPAKQRIELREDGKSGCLTTVQKDSLLAEVSLSKKQFYSLDKHTSPSGMICLGGLSGTKLWIDNGKLLQRNFSQGERIYSPEGKSPSLSANAGGTAGGGCCLVFQSIENLPPEPNGKEKISKLKDGYFPIQQGKKNAYEIIYRKLTPVECERLQTVPDEYTKFEKILKQKKKKGLVVEESWIVQNTPKTARYRMLGNGWTIDVIAHILSHMIQ